MATVIIPPRRQLGEIKFLLIATVTIIIVAVAAIVIRKNAGSGQQRLRSYQISGTSELSGASQGLYLDLYKAVIQINHFHNMNYEMWPTIEELENGFAEFNGFTEFDDYIAPFPKDVMWETRGRLTWQEQPTGSADSSIALHAYVGRTSSRSVAGSFLLLFEHYHSADGTYYLAGGKEAHSIWFRDDTFSVPGEINEGTLIQNGWKQVVAITGKTQREQVGR